MTVFREFKTLGLKRCISSRKSIPLCPKVASPGILGLPIKLPSLTEMWGLLNGVVTTFSTGSPHKTPAFNISTTSFVVPAGNIRALFSANKDFPVPEGPSIKILWCPEILIVKARFARAFPSTLQKHPAPPLISGT
ncbi:MAG: hypothetical protein ACD_25C00248G0003 [uncultured bacterium]|nr:MAG: hypothetical protein ACD_25C00248G0003 [uncultured bacterium]